MITSSPYYPFQAWLESQHFYQGQIIRDFYIVLAQTASISSKIGLKSEVFRRIAIV